jgi:hypothetical protein
MLVPLGLFIFMKYTLESLNSKKPIRSRLTAIEFLPTVKRYEHWVRPVLFKCDCGNEKIATASIFFKGLILSCGCYKKELHGKATFTKYRPVIPRLHNIYFQILQRCYNKSSQSYHNYGGRGVTMCDEWKNDYQKFLDWSINNGYDAKLEIDKDIRGDGLMYSPDDCSWVTRIVNINNKKQYKKYDYNEEKLTIAQIARLNDLPRQLLYFFAVRKGNKILEAIELSHNHINKKHENRVF